VRLEDLMLTIKATSFTCLPPSSLKIWNRTRNRANLDFEVRKPPKNQIL